jgi:hypothetical protein
MRNYCASLAKNITELTKIDNEEVKKIATNIEQHRINLIRNYGEL